jgi:hypothetical protein
MESQTHLNWKDLQILTHRRSGTMIHGDLVEVSSYLHVLPTGMDLVLEIQGSWPVDWPRDHVQSVRTVHNTFKSRELTLSILTCPGSSLDVISSPRF